MERFRIFISGRILSVIMLVGFNVLIVRMMETHEYGMFAVVIALASIVNTLGSLGAQRFLPKYVSLARQDRNALPVRKVLVTFATCRLAAVFLAAALCLPVTILWLDNNVQVEDSILVHFMLLSVFTALYMDSEIVSQCLNQQSISRAVAIFEPLARTAGTVIVASIGQLSAANLILLIICSQGIAALVLLRNGFTTLHGKIKSHGAQAKVIAPRAEMLGIIASGYVNGLTHLGTAPPIIRIIAASFLSASEFAVLSFVQTLTVSLQRYSPGFLMFPFVEPAIMGLQATSGPERFSRSSAVLSLIGKLDATLITLGILFLAPLAGTALVFVTGEATASHSPILLLSMTAIIGGTLVRTGEIAASFVGASNAIFLASGLSFIFVAILVLAGQSMGLLAILLFPVVDCLCRTAVLEAAARRKGFPSVVDWRVVLSCFALIGLAVVLPDLYFAPNQLGVVARLAFAGALVVLGIGCILGLGPMQQSERDLLAQHVNSPTAQGWLQRFVRR